MRVPYEFIWPVEMWGEKLGNIVSHIRSGNIHKNKREDLESIEFDFSRQGWEHYGWDCVKLALLTYKQLNEDLLVAQSFRVPYDDSRWPDNTWGMKLGKTVSKLRCGET